MRQNRKPTLFGAHTISHLLLLSFYEPIGFVIFYSALLIELSIIPSKINNTVYLQCTASIHLSFLSFPSTPNILDKSFDRYFGDFQTTIFILSPMLKKL